MALHKADFEWKRGELAARGWRVRMARNAINDHCEFKIGLKRTIGPRGEAIFHQMVTPPCTTPTSARKSRADRSPIAV
jgi:hypothetical protein